MVGSCFSVLYCSYLGGGGFHVLVNFLVELVFGYGVPKLDFVGMLVPRIGGGSGVGFRPFVVHPPSCWGGRFHTTAIVFPTYLLTHSMVQNPS